MLLLLSNLGPLLAQSRRPTTSPGPSLCPCEFCCCGAPVAIFGALGLIWLIVVSCVVIAIWVPMMIGMWKSFEKAGEPGWVALVPVYNCMIAAKITGRPEMHGLLVLIPFGVGIVFWIIICLDVARSFGRESGFGVGLGLLGPVFWAILGLGDAQYEGPTYEGDDFGYTSKRPRRRRRDEDDRDDQYRRLRDEDDYEAQRRRGRRDDVRRSRYDEDD